MYNAFFTVNTKTEVITVKSKLEDIFKKLQSYSFVLFIGLLVIAFVVVVAINQLRDRTDDSSTDTDITDVTDTDNTDVLNPNDDDIAQLLEEKFIIPVAENVDYEIARNYWDPSLPMEELYRTIIQTNNRYEQNRGLNYRAKDNEPFQVVASITGKVVRVENDSRLGTIVEIEHTDNIKTRYTSLSEAKVNVGDTVKQGDVIGVSGTNFDTESGNHVHFEVLQGTLRLNPNNMIGHKLGEFVNTEDED